MQLEQGSAPTGVILTTTAAATVYPNRSTLVDSMTATSPAAGSTFSVVGVPSSLPTV